MSSNSHSQTLETMWHQIHGMPGEGAVRIVGIDYRGNLLCQLLRIFCANFSSQHEGWTLWWKMWCRNCYKPMANDKFPILQPTEEDGFVVERDSDSTHFWKREPVITLYVLFNVIYVPSGISRLETWVLLQWMIIYSYMCQTCKSGWFLDALWARGPNTVAANLREWKHIINIGQV